MSRNPLLLKWIEELQAKGRYTFTRSQVQTENRRSFIAAQSALRRLKEQNRIVSPRRGFYVVVPPEYRAVGSPPASWFIDDLMHYLDQSYYVGLLSAAAIHGAAHQQPMVFQVITGNPTRDMRAGKVTIQFSMNSKIDQMPIVEKQTETGTMRVASPETCAFDMVRYSATAGHLSNVAMVLSEMADQMDAQALVEIAPIVRLPEVQRLGYLLDSINESKTVDPLARWLQTKKPKPVPLKTGETTEGNVDNRWFVHPNTELDLDL